MIQKNNILNRQKKRPILWDAFFRDDNMKKPLVIFCHGYKGFKDWGAWDLVAKKFAEAGLFFVKFNFSHNGGTIENPIDFPDLEAFAENNYSKELDDLDSMLNFLLSEQNHFSEEIDASNVTVIGHSRGGGIAIIKTVEDSRISKLITWASISDFGKRTATIGDLEQWQKDGVKYVLNSRTKQKMPHNFQFYQDFLTNKERLNIENATKKITSPFLIVHGLQDTSIPFSEAEALHTWNRKSELYLIPETNHVFNSKHPWETTKLPKSLNQVVNRSIEFVNAK